MGKQENSVRTTGASKKRAFASVTTPNQSLQQLPPTKKRVVLGELTNSLNAGSIRTSGFGDAKQTEPKLRKTKKKKEKIDESVKSDIVGVSDVPQKCGYARLIYQHLHSLEVQDERRPFPNYMETVQTDVTVSMREILLDWLVEVADEYKLVSETLYLTVSYIDRFLTEHPLSRNKLQLLGVSCMLVASKYEEITPPHVEDFCYITDNTYTKEEVVNMERNVLKFLNFEMGTPTTKSFLRIFTRAAQDNGKVSDLQFEFLSCYLAEISLLDYDCLCFLPSVVAASVVFISRFIIQPDMHPWNLALQQYSGYEPSDLKDCVLTIYDLQKGIRGVSLRAVKEKYMQHKFKCVAALPSPKEIPWSYFDPLRNE
ncbi:G2/mitotic-specific cyclin C13-1-like [Cornus florida]|uniref:G2/mitotic-specific cyclin C13-1-like n=1 Tax=Cornus florida TaxID=4283 RepID=UPI00289B69F5|nr:G2/mitotic-specific cyclin C13-1-like [Cornus florida]